MSAPAPQLEHALPRREPARAHQHLPELPDGLLGERVVVPERPCCPGCCLELAVGLNGQFPLHDLDRESASAQVRLELCCEFNFRYEIRNPSDLRALLNGEPELIRIAGALSNDPERRVLERLGLRVVGGGRAPGIEVDTGCGFTVFHRFAGCGN